MVLIIGLKSLSLDKYPVVSTSGRKYKVSIEEGFVNTNVHAIIYERKKSLWIFFEYVEVYRKVYDENGMKFNYIEMVKQTVEKYEALINDKSGNFKRRSDGVARFNHWEGEL